MSNKTIPDISHWERLEEASLLGTRDKIRLKNPESGQLYFIKFPKTTASAIVQEQEIMTEYIATELAKALGIAAHTCYPAYFEGRLGINTLQFIQDDKTKLLFPKELLKVELSARGEDFPEESDNRGYRTVHTFDNVIHVISRYVAKNSLSQDVLLSILQMILFDALVGMTDRHWENYGVIKEVKFLQKAPQHEILKSLQSNPRLMRTVFDLFKNRPLDDLVEVEIGTLKAAPLFDNSSCLFWNLQDTELPSSEAKMIKYAKNRQAFSHIGIPDRDKITLFELLGYINSGKALSNSPFAIPPLLQNAFEKMKDSYHNTPIESLIKSHSYQTFSIQRIDHICRYLDVRLQLIEETLNPRIEP